MDRIRETYWPWLATVAILLTAVVLLRAEGRSWWCACDQAFLWTSQANGPHTSRHLLDPYSFTHILHGVLLCGLLAWSLPQKRHQQSPIPWPVCQVIGRSSGRTLLVIYADLSRALRQETGNGSEGREILPCRLRCYSTSSSTPASFWLARSAPSAC